MKLNWLRFFTPTVILIILFVADIIREIYCKGNGWSLIAIFYLLPFIILLFVVDVILKVIKSVQAHFIWIIESALIAFLVLFLVKF